MLGLWAKGLVLRRIYLGQDFRFEEVQLDAERKTMALKFGKVPQNVCEVEDGCGVAHVQLGNGLWFVGIALAEEVSVEGKLTNSS